jgi:hypothetical protein
MLKLDLIMIMKMKKQLGLGIGLYFLCVSCGASKYAQCQQMFILVNQASKEVKTLTSGATSEDLSKFKEAAEALRLSGGQIANLELKDPQLIEYQKNFAQVYQSYAESTLQMIKAKETINRNLANEALKKVSEATQLEKDTGAKLQSYCVKE